MSRKHKKVNVKDKDVPARKANDVKGGLLPAVLVQQGAQQFLKLQSPQTDGSVHFQKI